MKEKPTVTMNTDACSACQAAKQQASPETRRDKELFALRGELCAVGYDALRSLNGLWLDAQEDHIDAFHRAAEANLAYAIDELRATKVGTDVEEKRLMRAALLRLGATRVRIEGGGYTPFLQLYGCVEAMKDIINLVVEKNAAYGDSALQPLRLFSQADQREQLLVRLDDKLNRIIQGEAGVKDMENLKDIVGYLLLLGVDRARRKEADRA